MKNALARFFVFAAFIFLLAYLQSDGVAVAAQRDCGRGEVWMGDECVEVPHHPHELERDRHEDEESRNARDAARREIENSQKAIIDEKPIIEDILKDVERGW